MLKITKSEAFAMRRMGYAGYVKKSYSKHPTYFLVEKDKVLREFEKYRKSLIVK